MPAWDFQTRLIYWSGWLLETWRSLIDDDTFQDMLDKPGDRLLRDAGLDRPAATWRSARREWDRWQL